MPVRSAPPVRSLATGACALLCAAVLTGCGHFGTPESSSPHDTTGPSGTPTGPPAPPSSSPVPAGGIDGSWLTTVDGKAVALVIGGEHAGLFRTDGVTCDGAAGRATPKPADGDDAKGKGSGKTVRTIALACSDGGGGRDRGTVESVTADSLKIKWEGLGEETYRRAGDPTALPSGLLRPPAPRD